MDKSKSPRWADMDDDEPLDLDVPVVITKHGVKVNYVPPHLRPDKTKNLVDNKKK